MIGIEMTIIGTTLAYIENDIEYKISVEIHREGEVMLIEENPVTKTDDVIIVHKSQLDELITLLQQAKKALQ